MIKWGFDFQRWIKENAFCGPPCFWSRPCFFGSVYFAARMAVAKGLVVLQPLWWHCVDCSALTFREFVPRLELLSPFRDFLGI